MMAEAYRRRRRLMLDALDEMGISYGLPQGGQFVFADISFTGLDSGELAQRILTEQHVLAYPGSAFSKDRKDYLTYDLLAAGGQTREKVWNA